MPVAVPAHDGQTRREIVKLLLESGTITAADIGRRLGISAAGVRRHLDALVDDGDAEANPAAAWQQVGRGRPAKRYRLTPAGRAKLEHSYDDLASAAMRQLREIGGDEAVRTFARRRIDTILAGVGAVNGDEASWSIDITSPMPMTLSFKGKVDGDKLAGTVTLGAFGDSTFMGERA